MEQTLEELLMFRETAIYPSCCDHYSKSNCFYPKREYREFKISVRISSLTKLLSLLASTVQTASPAQLHFWYLQHQQMNVLKLTSGFNLFRYLQHQQMNVLKLTSGFNLFWYLQHQQMNVLKLTSGSIYFGTFSINRSMY